MSINIQIGSKVYRNIDKLSIEKLKHILELNNIEITSYKEMIKNYSKERMEFHGTPFIKYLENNNTIITDILNKKEV